MIDLQYLATFLTIVLVFIILVLRACYYTFVAKSDPIKTLKPPNPFKVLTFMRKKKEQRALEQVS